jgi:hypothetical protein
MYLGVSLIALIILPHVRIRGVLHGWGGVVVWWCVGGGGLTRMGCEGGRPGARSYARA